MQNPLEGILPDFSIFGAEFTELWQKIMAGLWGLAMVAAVAVLILALMGMNAATTTSNPAEYKGARQRAVMSFVGLGVLAALGVIVTAILAVFG